MKAATISEYGEPEVIQVKEVEKPSPLANEILIRIRAAHLNYGDIIVRNFKNLPMREFNMPALFYLPARIEFGYNKPKISIMGSEFAGEVEAVGKDVSQFKKGDKVFGYRSTLMGTNAEYLAMPETGLVAHKPKNMSDEEAACIPYGGLTAMSLLRKANIQKGQKVLINGASGSIGAAALQLAKYYGAEVTGVCGTNRMEMVKALGADKVIDYSKEDFTKSGERYDLIFDVLGRADFSACKKVLNPNGVYLLASFKMKQVFQMLWTSKFGDKKVICTLSGDSHDDLLLLKDLAEAGHLKTVIDRCYPLAETAAAHRYVESGHKKGDVVITI